MSDTRILRLSTSNFFNQPMKAPKSSSAPTRKTAPTEPTPTSWVHTHFPFRLDPAQSTVLDTPSRRILVNCSRQWGKSTTAALRALHHALHAPQSTTIILSPSLRQSSELLRKVLDFALALHLRPTTDGINRASLQFPNRSRVIALPGNEHTTRGFSKVTLLIVDEASRVPDALYLAARPFLATTNGTLLLLSTPNGQRGFFYREWVRDEPAWTRISVPATACPRISPAFLADERRTLPDAFFRQEYLCEFTGAQNYFLRPHLVDLLSTTLFEPFSINPLPVDEVA